jgi:glutamate/tyrosine decarboxylase-like PLP-dependent enzyme
MVGDWIATGFNFYAGVWAVATGPNRVEMVVLDWFRRWLGMPEGSGGLLTTGGSAANLTAIVAARHHATQGDVSLIPRLAIYTSDQAHSSVSRAGWMAGIARHHVRAIATDRNKKMIVAELAQVIAADRAAGLIPCAVVASAGTTNTGAIDPMHETADLCEREKVWMHVDAAYGGFAVLTDEGRRALDGMARADTITLDPHKWLYVPFECGCLMAREPRRLWETYAIFPEYLKDVQGRGSGEWADREINFADYGEQLTRYNRSLKIWLSVNYFGIDAFRSTIQRTMDLARLGEQTVRNTPGLELLSPAQMGIFCFRVLDAAGWQVRAALLRPGLQNSGRGRNGGGGHGNKSGNRKIGRVRIFNPNPRGGVGPPPPDSGFSLVRFSDAPIAVYMTTLTPAFFTYLSSHAIQRAH